MTRILPRSATAALLLLLLAGSAAAKKGDRLRFDHYYSGPEVVEALQTLEENYPDLTRLEVIGTSEEGREIHALTIHNPETGSEFEKPAIYVDGAVHGNEVQAAEVCLYLADYLLGNYGLIDTITTLVDRRAFYIVPVVNVDSHWRYWEGPGSYSIGRTAIVPYDDDGDGLVDEDGYEDLNGDGEISQMRVADPWGEYVQHPKDDRILIPAEEGEQGQWTLLGREGVDNDGDGNLNEDPPGYVDMNRNYAFHWQPRYVQSGSGDFPLSAKPTRAVAEFIRSKPNIVFNYAFHNMGGMFLRGPGNEKDGPYPREDIRVYDYLGEAAERAVPGYRYLVSMDDLYKTWGDFDGFMYGVFGIYGFVGELYQSREDQYRRDDDEIEGDYPDREERQRFNDVLAHGTMFLRWTDYDHPELGPVQLGGWKTGTRRVGRPFQLVEMAHRNAAQVIFTASHAPDIRLEEVEVERLGEGLKRVRVRVVNPMAIPSYSAYAERNRIVRPDIISIVGRGLEVVSGGIVHDPFLDEVEHVEHRPHQIETRIPGFGRVIVEWIVRGDGKALVRYDSKKAANRELELKL